MKAIDFDFNSSETDRIIIQIILPHCVLEALRPWVVSLPVRPFFFKARLEDLLWWQCFNKSVK